MTKKLVILGTLTSRLTTSADETEAARRDGTSYRVVVDVEAFARATPDKVFDLGDLDVDFEVQRDDALARPSWRDPTAEEMALASPMVLFAIVRAALIHGRPQAGVTASTETTMTIDLGPFYVDLKDRG